MPSCINIKLPAVPKKLRVQMLPSLQELSPGEQGFMKGYNDGKQKATADCKQEMEERIRTSRAHWDAALHSLNELPKKMIQKSQEQLINLAFNVVRKILATTQVTREEIQAQVSQMLEHAEAGSEIEIQLNPADLELLTAEDRGALWNDQLTHLKWTPTPSIPRGGCVLHGEFGWMDGRRETSLKKMEQVAAESIQKSSS